MPCPICGANCQCKNRGAGGLCCDCHRHKPSAARVAAFMARCPDPPADVLAILEKHREEILAAENAKSWGDVMSKRVDLRNKGESVRWKPQKWSPGKARRFTRRTVLYAASLLDETEGHYAATLIVCDITSKLKAAESVSGVHAAGYKTLGDVAAEG